MDVLDETILREVEQHNRQGELIYRKRLVEILDSDRMASPVTVYKRVTYLLEDKRLIERAVTPENGRGIYKYLYIPGYEDCKEVDDKLDAIIRQNDEILRRLPEAPYKPFRTKEEGMPRAERKEG